MIHVLFCDSAAGTLRQVLRARGVSDRVVCLTEWLDWGWISSERIEDRVRWFEEQAGLDWDWLAECSQKFLAQVATDEDRMIWLAPRSAQDQCGFYWLLHRMQLPPNKMIVADYPLKGAWRGEPPLSLGELGPDHMAELLDSCPRRDWDISRFPLETWQSLMSDGAVLRIVEGGALKSAAADHFDSLIVDRCPAEWTKWYRVMGYSMADAGEAGHTVNDMFLRWRLQELIASGAIECQGTLPGWDAPVTINPAMIRRAN
jgi:hypothetical protein